MDAASPISTRLGSQARDIRASVEQLLRFARADHVKRPDPPPRWRSLDDSRGRRIIIGIATRGCSYARNTFGGCANCGHVASTLWQRALSDEEQLASFHTTLSEIATARTDTLCLFTSGSFLDDSEISAAARSAILSAANDRLRPRKVLIESLPSFISLRKLTAIRECIPAAEINISVGLDAGTELTRYICAAKDFTDNLYGQALTECRRSDIETTVYVSLGLPFLTRSEAICDAVAGLHKAVRLGAEAISLEPVALQEATLQKLLFIAEQYRPPTVWSVLETLLEWDRQHKGELQTINLSIGGLIFTPTPFRVFSACRACIAAATLRAASIGCATLFSQLPTTAVEGADCCRDNSEFLPSHVSLSQLHRRVNDALTTVVGGTGACAAALFARSDNVN
jgi:radical SAM enzyme (TIGR01210 family)